jgi:hypothetical protein
MDWIQLRYVALGGEKSSTARYTAIIAVLGDTVTTIYALYVSSLRIEEMNPVGRLLLDGGFLSELVFMSVPLFTILLLLYLPGILGNAVAVTNLVIHTVATGINLLNIVQLQPARFVPLTDGTIYTVAIVVSTAAGIMWYYPDLRRRSREYPAS